jgi:hypothetical protein
MVAGREKREVSPLHAGPFIGDDAEGLRHIAAVPGEPAPATWSSGSRAAPGWRVPSEEGCTPGD